MQFRAIVSLIGVATLVVGAFKCLSLIEFLQAASPVEATVVAVEHRSGPPKPRQNTPLHVRYKSRDGQEVLATTHLPLLQVVKEGETLTLLASTKNPQDVRLPLISELWATPLTYVIVGLCGVLVGVVLRANQLLKERSANRAT